MQQYKIKISILSTRALNDTLLTKAAEKNIYIDAIPFIKTETVLTPEIHDRIQILATQKKVTIFTSVNAVEAVNRHLKQKPDWTIYCMGGVTKDAVYDIFGKHSVTGTAKTATSLAEKIVDDKAVNDVVFFCGDQRLDDLSETLISNKIKVEELVVYNTIQTPQSIEKNYNAVLFFSPSAVHSFFSENTIAINVKLFSIGKTTTATIQTYCTNPVITSEWPGKDQMIELVMKHFG